MPKLFYSLLLWLAVSAAAHAQSPLFIDPTISPQQMVEDFFNTSQVTVSNVTYSGTYGSIAYFEAANTDLDLLAGIMLSTGDATLASNPAAFFASSDNSLPGDPALDVLTTSPTFNATSLSFQVVPQTDTLCFIYRFASEEYPEFTCSDFNDVFAFFVSGPGYPSGTNIALVPGTVMPVAINNVHADFTSIDSFTICGAINEQYFVDYEALGGQDATYDGFTTTLPAKFAVQPGETYYIKLAIADAGDPVFDSGVFIAINSLGGDSLLAPVAGMLAPVVDGNTVTFTNTTHYGTSWHWDFGDGTTSNERYPGPHTYPQFSPNGDERVTYTVTLISTNYCCADTTVMLVTIGSSGIAEIVPAAPFQLAPNPASDYLLILPTEAGAFSVRVTDVAGRLLRREEAAGSLRLDMANWLPGVYVVEFQQENRVARQRFVKK